MQQAPVKKIITREDLEKIDIRVGTILTISNVPNSKKLVALQVDFGDHQRTILAGLQQERQDPTEIKGKQALFMVNMAPQKMAGMVSEGMLFDLGYDDGITPVLAQPEKPLPNGVKESEPDNPTTQSTRNIWNLSKSSAQLFCRRSVYFCR